MESLRQAASVLLVDDDVELCELLARFLAAEGFAVEAVHDGATAAERALTGTWALVLLDMMLPGRNGLEVLRQIRARSRVPVVMLTAKGDAVDRILGLEIGADDYVPKPFNPQELAARMRAVLRRASPRAAGVPGSIAVDDVELQPAARVVRQAGEVVDLTTVEFDLLQMLLSSAGEAISRQSLVRNVLGREFSPFDRSIDTHVCNLRRKLGPLPGGGDRIVGVRGIGYLYACSARSFSHSG
jgi:two-component system, OmpR family, response regulator CpxR